MCCWGELKSFIKVLVRSVRIIPRDCSHLCGLIVVMRAIFRIYGNESKAGYAPAVYIHESSCKLNLQPQMVENGQRAYNSWQQRKHLVYQKVLQKSISQASTLT